MPLRLLLLFFALLLAPPALAQDRSDADGDDIDQETLLQKAAPLIQDLYLHPDAVEPSTMLRAGLQALEHKSPRILVLEAGPNELKLQVDAATRVVATDDVATLEDVFDRFEVAAAWAHPELADPDITLDDLRAAALAAALRTIDRHSRVIAGDRLDDFNTRFKGTLVGIGARIGRRDGALRVIKPFTDAPAGRAGLLAWDAITHVDGVSTEAMGVNDAVDRIRGPEGVPVVLTVLRDGEPGPRVFVIVRERVLVPSVEGTLLSGNIGYIAIDHFSKKTSQEFVDHAERLGAEAARAGGALAGIVIDLRENQGGSMIHAARIVNHFVDQGLLIQTEGRDGGKVRGLTWKVPAKPARKRYDGPVAVLVNSRTASGSEIVAGGLKFLERAVVIGSQTFGKGTVQKVYSLTDDVSMKLTVARYLLPGQRFINSVGVTPDVMTGQIWLDPDDPTVPDALREPPEAIGLDDGPGALDSGHNPGAGRPPTVGGTNAAPGLRLLYPRVLAAWTEATKDGAAENASATEAATEAGTESSSEATPGGPPADPTGDAAARSNLPGDAGEPQFNDMELRLAHELLLQAKVSDRRPELIGLARPIVLRWQRLQNTRLTEGLAAHDVPWTTAEKPTWIGRTPARADAIEQQMLGALPPLTATLTLPDQFVAGADSTATLVVENTGTEPQFRLRARLESSSDALDGASFLLGDLAPGEKRTAEVAVSHSSRAETRRDAWRLYLLDDSGPLGGPWRGTVDTVGNVAPDLQMRLATQLEAEPGGGVLLTAMVEVRNASAEATDEVRVQFGDANDERVERMERFRTIETLGPNESGEVTLTLRVRDPESLTTIPIRLRASDLRTGQSTTVALELPTGVPLTRTEWYSAAQVAFTSPADAAKTAASGPSPFPLRGEVVATSPLESIEVIVGGDKLFTQHATADQNLRTMPFDVAAPLEAGENLVLVRTRTADGVSRTGRLWVHRQEP